MSNNQRSLTTFMYEDKKLQDGSTCKITYLEGFVRTNKEGSVLTERTVNTKDGRTIKAVSLNISVVLSEYQANNLFGYVNEQYGSYFVRINMIGQAAERIIKYNPQKNQILGFFGDLNVSEYTKNDGSSGKSVCVDANNWKVCTRRSDSTAPAASVPQPSTTPTVAEDDWFMSLPENLDEFPFV